MFIIAICDDEEQMLDELKEYINRYMQNNKLKYEIFCFTDANELLKSKTLFDVIFLDININDVNGIEAAKYMRSLNIKSFFVFITVLNEYVYDAFEVEAIDYMIKPVDIMRFNRTMDRICSYIEQKQKNTIVIQKGGCYNYINFFDIYYCEAINRKVYVHMKYSTMDYYCKMEELENQLDRSFFRCHRSYIVNLQYVCGYGNGFAQLDNKEFIPVSRLRYQDFLQAVLYYMKKGKK